MKATYAMSLWSLLSPNRETTGLESYTNTYLFTQQVQTIRVTEIFFGVKHLQEEDKKIIILQMFTDVAEIAPQGCFVIHKSYCQRGVNPLLRAGRE